MSLERKDPQMEEDIKDMKLSKYGFGFKLTSFTAMLGWVGMIKSVITGIAGLTLFTVLIDLARNGTNFCYHSRYTADEPTCELAINGTQFCYYSRYPGDELTCGLFVGGGIFLCLISPIWFYLSFQLRKKVQEHDLIGVTKTLKIICYIQGAFSILLSGPLMVFPILCIIGIVQRRTKFVKIYIIYTIVMVVLFNVIIICGSIASAAMTNFGSYFLFGVLEGIGYNLLFIYYNGFIIILHTIMEHNDNKFTVFKNKHTDFENPMQDS